MDVGIAHRAVSPQSAGVGNPSGPAPAELNEGAEKASFREHLDSADSLDHPQTHDLGNAIAAGVRDPEPIGSDFAAASTRRVNGASIPDQQDLFGRFEKIRRDFDGYLKKSEELDKLVASGKLSANDPRVQQHHRAELRMLLHFQGEMQSAAIQVEIASKVIEHGTSGAKTVLSTQA